ncbi:MAG: site-2 protease family protein [bacterium]|nr:site-2 protease family protein [bacterium]
MRLRSPILTIFIVIALFQIFIGSGRFNEILNHPLAFVFLLLAILIALVMHEFFHAWTADRLGDPNPRLAGRVSLNPFRHLDPWGTLLIILTGFGWGKPVQFDAYNLKDPVKDGALIAAAGPSSNLLLALLVALVLRFFPLDGNIYFLSFLVTLFSVNLSLGVFNLLPIYPLDGHHILRAFLPESLCDSYDSFNKHWGMIVAFLFILPIFGTAPVNYVLVPAINFLQKLFLGI